MERVIIVTNGLAQSGKSTFCEMVKEYCDTLEDISAIEVSTIDYIKRVAMACGWNGKKTAKARVFLHDLKIAFEKFNNSPNKEALNDAKNFIDKHPEDNIIIVFCNIREADSIKRFVTLAKKEGYEDIRTIKVISDRETNEAPDVIAEIDKIEYNMIIDNTGTLEDLRESAKVFVNGIRADYYL